MTKKDNKRDQTEAAAGAGGIEPDAQAKPPYGFIDSDKILDKWVEERKLADQLGVSRSELSRLRKESLKPEESRHVNGLVEVLRAAVERLIGTEILDKAPPVEYAEMIVQRFWPNPSLLGCSIKQKGDSRPVPKPSDLQLVKVRDQSKFHRGMEVPCKRKKGDRIWSLACRHPKKKGKIKA